MIFHVSFFLVLHFFFSITQLPWFAGNQTLRSHTQSWNACLITQESLKDVSGLYTYILALAYLAGSGS